MAEPRVLRVDTGGSRVQLSSRFGADGIGGLQVLSKDSGLALCRGWRDDAEGTRKGVLIVFPASERPTPAALGRVAHEYSFKDELDDSWSVKPLELIRDRGRSILVLEDPGGELLNAHVGKPMEVAGFLRIAIGLAAALGKAHQRGLIHKDIKPANILVNTAGEIRLTGFGIASRLTRERQAPDPPEAIAGTLAYMAPEQTGRMNRSIDSRSDLYSLGVTLYEMLTGSLPFTASDPMEWVHCHIARQAHAPGERANGIPEALSSIVMKLLAKTAEERYQTAAGVEADLRRCLGDWQRHGRIEPFPLAARDTSDRLLIPEQLYGRQREIATLLASFDRVVTHGAPEFILVSGYSGVGKSSVVNELHKVLVPQRGLFASGKFDQYKRDIPYATVAQAFQSLVRQILSKSEAELEAWREALREALGPNGRLIVDLIPELELVTGEQPPVADLSPQDAKRRYQTVLRRFIGVFARPEHPLALFLDDLQWLDAATLDLLEDILAQQDIGHLLLIGAYRDNEVDTAHPLMRRMDAIRRAGAAVEDIVLAPLAHDDLTQMISDSIRCGSEPAAPLVQLVHEKTGGNPFFAVQFLTALADEGLLIFDHADARWICDLGRIRAKGYTDNVVDLMVAKLERLPAQTLAALRQLACVGFRAEFAFLGTICQMSQDELQENLWAAVQSGLVHCSENAYAFLHDRIQEAAYSLIPEGSRADAHLRIGRLLVAHTPPDKREGIIFEIVNQFNRTLALITSQDEREQVAQLNLNAGKRARNAVAYSSALTHFVAGRALLTDDCWTLQYPLTFELEFHQAECEFLTGDLASAEERLSVLSSSAANLVDLAAVTCLRVDLYAVLGRSDRAIAVCLDYLQKVGVEWSPHPTDEDVRREHERIWQLIGSRPIEDLIDLPLMNDAGTRGTMDVLTKVMPSTQILDNNLFCLMITRMVNLSLEYGNCNASCCGYIWFGLILSSYFENYPAARRFGQLSLDLVERRALDAFKARVYEAFGIFVSPWAEHVRSGRTFVQQAFDEANRIGDLTYVVYCCLNFVTNSLAYGERLIEVEREATEGIDLASKAGFGLVVDIILGHLCLIRMLRGLTRNFNSFDDTKFDERKFEERLEADPNLAIAACPYWIRKLQARVFALDYSSALEAATKAQALLWTSPALFEQAEYYFYAALARAGALDATRGDQKIAHLEALAAHYKQLQIWAEHCPENFENRVALVGAELARLEGRELDAERLYEQAISSARANGFVHNEALACETAARCYAGRGFEDIAEMYLLRARDGYRRWGADAKVRQLDRLYPHLAGSERQGLATATGSAVQQLDVTSVVKASQALSSEIVLPKLIQQLMKIAIENAGADRSLLILPSGDECLIHAEARAAGDEIEVAVRQEPMTGSACPESLVRYVIRTRESVILDDASKPNLFSADNYLRDRNSKSILCLPLIKQQRLTGILLLENTLTSRAFTADRIAVLELIAAQAAISLENSRLYGDLLRSGADLRLQVELLQQLPVGAWTLKPDGTPDFVNRVWLEFAGQTVDFVRSHPEAWMTAVHPEDREFAARSFWKGVQSGQGFAFEARSLRARDGVYRRHLQQAVVLRDAEGKVLRFVGTTTDIDDQKRAEEALRQAAAELAHANRVATMGQLSASIAHEVNQPIAATLTNAGTAKRWLARQPPNLEGATQSLDRIVNDTRRAADIVSRIRDLAKKAPAHKADVEINEAILEIMVLARAALSDHGVSLKMQLSEGLHSVLGDRVQLQQVMLNLVMNAIEAMSEVAEGARELTIGTGNAEADSVLVTVRDTGPGLPPATLARIFDAFYTTKDSGLGMGLSICRSIVEAHGGRLWAMPNEPRGAVFCVMLPVGNQALANPESPEA